MLSKDEDRCVHGTCIWFSDEKGYGFLLSDDGVSSMVHYTDIKGTRLQETLQRSKSHL